MTPDEFCYWLRGYFEISKAIGTDTPGMVLIEEHLNRVFEKVKPKPNKARSKSLIRPSRRIC